MLHAMALSLALSWGLAGLVWLASLARRDASLADRFWSLFIVGSAAVHLALAPAPGAWAQAGMAVAALWAARLALYLTWRNWGHGEDRRYAAMRAQYGPRFAWVSALTVFGLQGTLAWVIGWPLAALAWAESPAGWQAALAGAGLALALAGAVFEAVADAQLARFVRRPDARGRVMDQGLWRYSRHPNYFGEACVWWGLGLSAGATGTAFGALALLSPLLITGLLLRVSGVTLLERDMAGRRPGYADYVRRTNAFWPGRPRTAGLP